MRLSDLGWSS